MKTLTIIILALTLFSCSGSTAVEEGKDFNFSYSVDTVMVDPGDGILFLRLGLNTAALSPNQNQLHNFNPANSEMEIIDLESLRLTDRIKMEKEGPTGTGRPRKIMISEDGKTFFAGFMDLREFDPQLTSMKTYNIRREKFEGLGIDQFLDFDMAVSQDGKFVFTPFGPENDELARAGLAVMNLENRTLKTFPLEIWERLNAYIRRFFEDGKMISRTNESAYIDPVDNRVLLSSANFNEVYILDLLTDSISHKIYHSMLTEDLREIPSRTSFDNLEQIPAIITEMDEQVSFGRFYYDDFHKKFW
jgi:hypothetical protein